MCGQLTLIDHEQYIGLGETDDFQQIEFEYA